jgi:hypothetical protein
VITRVDGLKIDTTHPSLSIQGLPNRKLAAMGGGKDVRRDVFGSSSLNPSAMPEGRFCSIANFNFCGRCKKEFVGVIAWSF